MTPFYIIFISILTIQMSLSNSVRAAEFSFDTHWSFPIPPQGPPPENFSPLEASLLPKECGVCHETQYTDWSSSRHSKAMGAGIRGQLHSPWLDEKGQRSCMQCHAPLAEQSPYIFNDNGPKNNPVFQPELRLTGLTCAGCHVRSNIRYGPTPLFEKKEQDDTHNSFIAVNNFGSSLFCKPCHQFNPGDMSINGKLLQNTFNEWKSSSFSSKGVNCSGCHMPERRHTWRGIHDKIFVEKGIKIESVKIDGSINISILNNNTGHYFPTYVTPLIVIRGSLIDNNGKEIPDSVKKKFIGRDITLDISIENFDTRIPPGERFKANFKIGKTADARKYRLTIEVRPDEFYRRFFKAILENPPAGMDLKKINEALIETNRSPYTLFERYWDLENT